MNVINTSADSSFVTEYFHLSANQESIAMPLCLGENKHNAKLTKADVRLMRELKSVGLLGYKRAAKFFNISIDTAKDVLNNKTWRSV